MQLLDTTRYSDLPPSLRVERVGLDRFAEVRAINEAIFNEARVINQLDRRDLVMLLATFEDIPIGFKVGYGENRTTFYSAKGGTMPLWRRRGLARLLLAEMMNEARALGYLVFAFDTFPNMHPGMTVLGLAEGFRVTAAGYNASYRDYRLRFEKEVS
ncbi:MAG: GNAT family N-acetyltransferase [Bacteroidota bacterium]